MRKKINVMRRYHPSGLLILLTLPLMACSYSSPSLYNDPKQIIIPAGHVPLGSDAKEKALGYRLGGKAARKWRWFDQEKQRHVFLPRYAIDRFLVTQSEYEQFVMATHHRVPFITKTDYQKQGFLVHPYKSVKKYLWQNGHPPPSLRDHPVVLVSVDDAEAYCQWRGKQHGRTYRLPTENEWEKAARGVDQQYFPWGNQWDPNRLNSAKKGPYHTTPVHQYPQGISPFGSYDMAGNVFQWTHTSAESQPQRNVLKGCSWDDKAGICRSASRHTRLKSSRHLLIGFRCVQLE